MCLSLETLKVHHNDWFTYSDEIDRHGELRSLSNKLTQTIILLGSLTVILTVLHFWIYLFLLMLVFVL